MTSLEHRSLCDLFVGHVEKLSDIDRQWLQHTINAFRYCPLDDPVVIARVSRIRADIAKGPQNASV